MIYLKGDRAVPLFQPSAISLASWENAITSRITHSLKFGSWCHKLWHRMKYSFAQFIQPNQSTLDFLVEGNDTLYCSNLCTVRFLFPRFLKVYSLPSSRVNSHLAQFLLGKPKYLIYFVSNKITYFVRLFTYWVFYVWGVSHCKSTYTWGKIDQIGSI